MDVQPEKNPRDYKERLKALREASRETAKNGRPANVRNQRGILKQSSTSLDKNREFAKMLHPEDGGAHQIGTSAPLKKNVEFGSTRKRHLVDQNSHPNITLPLEHDGSQDSKFLSRSQGTLKKSSTNRPRDEWDQDCDERSSQNFKPNTVFQHKLSLARLDDMRNEISTVDQAGSRLEGENLQLQSEIRITLQKLGERINRLKQVEITRDSSEALMRESNDSSVLMKEHIRTIEEAIKSTTQDLSNLHLTIHNHQKHASETNSELTHHKIELQNLKQQIKELQLLRGPEDAARFRKLLNQSLDKLYELSELIKNNFRLYVLDFVVNKTLYSSTNLRMSFWQISCAKMSNLNPITRRNLQTARSRGNSPNLTQSQRQMLPQLKNHLETNNLKLQRLLLDKLHDLYCPQKTLKNKVFFNHECLQSKALKQLRGMINQIRTKESIEVIKFDRLSRNQQQQIWVETQLKIISTQQEYFQQFRDMMLKFSLYHNQRAYTLKTIQYMSRKVSQANYNRVVTSLKQIEGLKSSIKYEEHQSKHNQFRVHMWKFGYLFESIHSRTKHFCNLDYGLMLQEFKRKGAPLFLFKTKLYRTKAATEYLLQIERKINTRLLAEFLSLMKKAKFLFLRKVQEDKLRKVADTFQQRDSKLKTEIKAAKRKQGLSVIQNMFCRLSDSAFRQLKFNCEKLDMDEQGLRTQGLFSLRRIFFKKRASHLKAFLQQAISRNIIVADNKIQSNSTLLDNRRSKTEVLTADLKERILQEKGQGLMRVDGLIRRYKSVQKKLAIEQLKFFDIHKFETLKKVFLMSTLKTRRSCLFVIHKLRRVGRLPPKKNLNPHNLVNLTALSKCVAQVSKTSHTRIISFIFKRIQSGKINPTFSELPYLLFSFYCKYLIRKKTQDQSRSFILLLKQLSLQKEKDRLLRAKNKHEQGLKEIGHCQEKIVLLQNKELKYKSLCLANLFWRFGWQSLRSKDGYSTKSFLKLKKSLFRWRSKCKFTSKQTLQKVLKDEDSFSQNHNAQESIKLSLNLSRLSRRSSLVSNHMSPVSSVKNFHHGVQSVLRSSSQTDNSNSKKRSAKRITFKIDTSNQGNQDKVQQRGSPLLSPKSPRNVAFSCTSLQSGEKKIDFSYRKAGIFSPHSVLLLKLLRLERLRKQNVMFEIKFRELENNITLRETTFEEVFNRTMGLKQEIESIHRDLEENATRINEECKLLKSKKSLLKSKIMKYADIISLKEKLRQKHTIFHSMRNLDSKALGMEYRRYREKKIRAKYMKDWSYVTRRDRKGRHLIEVFSRILNFGIASSKTLGFRVMRQIHIQQGTTEAEKDLLEQKYKVFKAKKLLEKITSWRNGIKPGALMRNLPVYLYALRLFQAWKSVIKKCKLSRKSFTETENEETQDLRDAGIFGADCVENDEFKQAYKKIKRNYVFRCWKKATVKDRILGNIASIAQRAEQSQIKVKALSVASAIKDVANHDRISRLVCRRYLDRIITQITIIRQINFRRCFDCLRDNRIRSESVTNNKMASILRQVFSRDQMVMKKYGFCKIESHAEYGSIFRLKHVLKFEKSTLLRKFFQGWRSYSMMESRVRNENVLERLLFNKMCLTFGVANKKRAFDHRLKEKCLGEKSYRFRSSRVQLALDELYSESLKRKAIKGFSRILRVRLILRKKLDTRIMALRKLRDLVGIDPRDYEETFKKDIIQLKNSFSVCVQEQKSLEIQARHLNEYLHLDKLQRNKNIDSILKGTLQVLNGLLLRHHHKVKRNSFELIREYANPSPCNLDEVQEIEEIEYLDQQMLDQDNEHIGSIVQSRDWEEVPKQPKTEGRGQNFGVNEEETISNSKMQVLLRNVSRALKFQSRDMLDLRHEQQILKYKFHQSLDGFKDIQMYLEDKAELAIRLDDCEQDIKTMQDENRSLKTLIFRAREEKDNMLQILRGLIQI